MKTIYFVRHGQTEGNANGMYQHWGLPLSELGREQAQAVAQRFDSIEIDTILVSDMERAIETAKTIAERIQKTVQIDPLFREIARPVVIRGRSKTDPDVVEIIEFTNKYWNDPSVKHSDEENFPELKARALRAVERLETMPEDSILVVTHGFFLHMVVAVMQYGHALTPEAFDRTDSFLHMSNTGITVCKFDGRWRMWTWNDDIHIQ